MNIDKRNIFLTDSFESQPYSPHGGNRSTTDYPVWDNPKEHVEQLQRELQQCLMEKSTQAENIGTRCKEGTYIEFSSAPEYRLKLASLENMTQKIRLLNVRSVKGEDEKEIQKATVYVPQGKEKHFVKKTEEYSNSLEAEKPKNADLINSIANVQIGNVESFWTGKRNEIPGEEFVWCEVWLRIGMDRKAKLEDLITSAENNLKECCEELGIDVDWRKIIFPERIVKLIKANREVLEKLVVACDVLAEMRRAPESANFFDMLDASEQAAWAEELKTRISFHDTNATVCLLDSGVSSAHPLLEPIMRDEDIGTIKEEWGVDDAHDHGTGMAGIAAYKNLKDALVTSGEIEINHRIESVKILPRRGENRAELYGDITKQAVSIAEIANPNADRAICMAVTSDKYGTDNGSPTSWSAAIDSITSGADDEGDKRLFFISAGNVLPNEIDESGYPDANVLHSVENPGQAWNAVTVGAFTKDIQIKEESFSNCVPVADNGDLSPYSSTSKIWERKWPIKPEILLDGGNMVKDETGVSECPDLSLLTTSKETISRKFSLMQGTSPATAQAAWMAAELYAAYPGIWPETVRALMIHSARWTDRMYSTFCKDDTKSGGRRMLLQTCGYGIPDLNRAIQCMDNSVNMIIEAELKPYGERKMNEMHIHEIPWPSEELAELGDVEVELRVTLSYFIEPGPGEIGWKDRYRYPSHSLRFDVINSDETKESFQERISARMKSEDMNRGEGGTSGSDRWYLGRKNRDVGSIHSDYIRCSAVDLCNTKYLAVYPVTGWWLKRHHLGKENSTARYSLVISLSSPEVDADLYTPIMAKCETRLAVDIPITV